MSKVEVELTEKEMDKIDKVHEYIERQGRVSGNKKTYLLTAVLTALRNANFKTHYEKQTQEYLPEMMVNVAINEFKSNGVSKDKIDKIRKHYVFIEKHPAFKKGDILANIIKGADDAFPNEMDDDNFITLMSSMAFMQRGS